MIMQSQSCPYPFGKWVLETIERSGMKPAPFLREIGIINVSKAMRRLEALVLRGEVSTHLMDMIQASPYQVPDEQLLATMVAHWEYLHAEKEARRKAEEEYRRARFVPHLTVIPELTRPTSITMYAFTGGNSRYAIVCPNKILQWSEESRLSWIKEAICRMVTQNRGRTLMMGRMTGYRFHFDFDLPPQIFNTEGDPVDVDPNSLVKPGEASVSINNRTDHSFSFR